MKVPQEVLMKAVNCCRVYALNQNHVWYGWYFDYHSFGVSNKQWRRYKQTGVLRVTEEAYIKLKQAPYWNSPHKAMLNKLVEIRSKEGKAERD